MRRNEPEDRILGYDERAHTHIYTSEQVLTHARIHKSAPANIDTHAHAPKHTNTHTTYKRAHTHTSNTHKIHARSRINTHARPHTRNACPHTHTHTNTYTHTQKSILVPFHETQCRNPLKPKIKCICLTNTS